MTQLKNNNYTSLVKIERFNSMKRNYNLDLMRVFLCLCVITAHSILHFGIENNYVSAILTVFLLQADGLFYMLSGYFNLEKEFKNSTDIKNYYKSKIINVLFPFLAFLFAWGIWDYIHVNETFNILDFLSTYYEQVMDSAANSHLWFMYPLFGLLLATPFLSKMLHNMDDKELNILWYIAIGWNFICCYLCEDLGISFRLLAWFLEGWTIYYFAGYYYRHVVSKQKKYVWFIAGLLCFALTNIANFTFDRFVSTTDIQPLFTIFCVACLMFWDKAFTIKNEKVQKVVNFLSKNTFLIYLYHMRGMEYALRKLPIGEPSFVSGLLVVLGTFVFSLIASFVTNLALKPIQKFIDKKWIIKN